MFANLNSKLALGFTPGDFRWQHCLDLTCKKGFVSNEHSLSLIFNHHFDPNITKRKENLYYSQQNEGHNQTSYVYVSLPFYCATK